MKKALIVGINAYPAPNTLHGCVNDAMDCKATLEARGFACTMVLDAQATKAGILAGLNALVNGAQSGDSLVFAYSGHGSQVRDVSGDETDGWDEVICPVNWPQYVSDDDLRGIFNRLPAGTILDVFLDSCHSGTGTREILEPGITIKALPPLMKKRHTSKKGKVNKAIVLVPGLNHCLQAGCADNQTSAEVSMGGVPRGAFSYYEYKAIRAGYTRAGAITYAEQRLAALGLNQVPQLEATQSESTQMPFT
jgi:metacaspase-1